MPQEEVFNYMYTGAQAIRPTIRTIAFRVIAGLMALEFTVTAFFLYIRSTTATQMVVGMAYKAGLLILLVPVVTNHTALIGPSFQFLVDSGTTVAGRANPFEVSKAGNDIFFACMKAAAPGWSLNAINKFFIVFFAACVMWIIAQLVAILITVTLIESAIVVYGGSLFLAFGMSRFTAGLADNYFAYALGVGVKIFFLYVICGILGGQAADWIIAIEAIDEPEDFPLLYDIAGAAMVFGFTALYVPATAAAKITSGFQIGFQRAHQPL